MNEKVSEAVGPNYRYFLGWRHAAFGANIIVLWGTASLIIAAFKDALPLVWIIPLLACPIGLLLWIADKRTRQIYRKLVKAGKDLEPGGIGPYSELERISIPRNVNWFCPDEEGRCKLISQSTVLTLFFLRSSVVLFLLYIYLKFVMLAT